MADLLSEDQITSKLMQIAWNRHGEEIVREWTFADFAGAIAFVNRVAAIAEEANHHPDILLHDWNQVKLSLTNHSAGGLTQADFTIAARFDQLG
jgi:4a-hydroxytetrahydrobiopterin dehydratase